MGKFNIKRAAASVAAIAALTVGGVALTEAPAQATVVNHTCITNGWTGEWYATGYRNGVYVWSGPRRTLRSTALSDCRAWLNHL
jgi:cellobiose phosphorylase